MPKTSSIRSTVSTELATSDRHKETQGHVPCQQSIARVLFHRLCLTPINATILWQYTLCYFAVDNV